MGKPNDKATAPDESVSLASTVDSFANRIRRKLKESEERKDLSQKITTERHALMLKAMTAIRKALMDSARISLGERFKFDLRTTDWEGWPRVELKLVDSHAPDQETISLMVLAHDRHDMGTIQMALKSGEILGRVHLRDANEYARLPMLLKRCVRNYLDLVANYVLNPQKIEETLAHQTRALDEDAVFDPISSTLKDANVFVQEEALQSDNKAAVQDELVPLDTPLSAFAK